MVTGGQVAPCRAALRSRGLTLTPSTPYDIDEFSCGPVPSCWLVSSHLPGAEVRDRAWRAAADCSIAARNSARRERRSAINP
jgi:hypothetical protein